MRKHLAKNNFGQFMDTIAIGDFASKLGMAYFEQFPDVDLDDLMAIFLSKFMWVKTQVMLKEVKDNGLTTETIDQKREE